MSARHAVTALELHNSVKLLADGTIRVTVRASCPRGFQVIEGPLTVMQGPEGQEIFGEGFFTTRCDGHWRLIKVRVTAPEASFQPGAARASASLMVEHPVTAEFQQGDDSEVVRVR